MTIGKYLDFKNPPLSSVSLVNSVFGRTGTVIAQTNDYTWGQINKAVSSIADIATRSHTLLTDIGINTHASIDSHITTTTNPHGVSLSQTNLTVTGTFDISNTAPAITLTDTTISAKSLKIDVDGDVAQIREKAGAIGSLMTFDLIANRVGINMGSALPGSKLEISGANVGLTVGNRWGNSLDNISFIGKPDIGGGTDAGAAFFKFIDTLSAVDAALQGTRIEVHTHKYNFGTNLIVMFAANGNVAIGTMSPTASLHIKAGTAAANTAPLKLTPGVNMTLQENGAFEFDGVNLYFTVGGVRKTVSLI